MEDSPKGLCTQCTCWSRPGSMAPSDHKADVGLAVTRLRVGPAIMELRKSSHYGPQRLKLKKERIHLTSGAGRKYGKWHCYQSWAQSSPCPCASLSLSLLLCETGRVMQLDCSVRLQRSRRESVSYFRALSPSWALRAAG